MNARETAGGNMGAEKLITEVKLTKREKNVATGVGIAVGVWVGTFWYIVSLSGAPDIVGAVWHAGSTIIAMLATSALLMLDRLIKAGERVYGPGFPIPGKIYAFILALLLVDGMVCSLPLFGTVVGLGIVIKRYTMLTIIIVPELVLVALITYWHIRRNRSKKARLRVVD